MDTTIESAEASARRAADQFGPPQTVYRNETTGGWWHTHSLALRLRTAELAVTVLPRRYFE
ncbi:hypothetical protein [Cupriavidus sp. USMAA2-4]|uniref:hypothetical protein n=1 Tax=Cupriavidus sp. USMAA2-4 TaxID=876364 RepID=UPI001E4005D2|nr:hypothetical protein [Cupriavidus sp. USMAA2-4]